MAGRRRTAENFTFAARAQADRCEFADDRTYYREVAATLNAIGSTGVADETKDADAPGLDADAQKCRDLFEQIDRAEGDLYESSRALADAATARLKAQRMLRRTGMRARLREVFEKEGVTRLHFEVSNGIDYGDDFGVTFTLAEIQEGAATVAARYEAAARKQERNTLLARQAQDAARLSELDRP